MKIQKATVGVAFALPAKGKFALKNSVLIIELKSSPNLKTLPFPQLKMIESIDDKIFYSNCMSFDNSNGDSLVANIVQN